MARVVLRDLTARMIALILCETTFIVVAIGAAAYLRLGGFATDIVWSVQGLLRSLLMAGVFQITLYYSELYDLRVSADRSELFVRILRALAATSIILAIVYSLVPELIVGRGVFAIAVVLVVPVVVGWRIAFDWLAGRVGPRERLLLVGSGAAAVRLARELHERADLGVSIVGFVDPDPAKVGQPVFNPAIVGTIDQIPEIAARYSVDRVVVSLADARGRLPMAQLLEMKLQGVTFDHLASVYEEYTGKISIDGLRPSWLIFSKGFRKSPVLHAVKRAIDIIVSLIGLVVGLPLFAAAAAAVKLTSAGPVFYHQRRVGLGGRVFTLHKFRSMVTDAEAGTGAVWARPGGDDRITRAGRFMRRSRLDELPQLLNVLRGEMSIVGPRPERPEFVGRLGAEIAFYGQRHVIKPGLTGWAQVRYTYGASVTDATEKLQFDLFYIKHMSIALDLFIMFKTIQIVMLGRGV